MHYEDPSCAYCPPRVRACRQGESAARGPGFCPSKGQNPGSLDHIWIIKPMAAFLQETAKQGIASNYVRQILEAFGQVETKTSITKLLIEPLTERELEVLKLLGTYLKGPEIARQLMVSLNTMRTHTKNIYNKLSMLSQSLPTGPFGF